MCAGRTARRRPRYPQLAVTAMKLRAQSFTVDGEACVCGPDGVAVFDDLHRRDTVREAMLYAFELLELDGEDLRGLPLGDRKKRRGCWAGAGSASCSATTPPWTAPPSSGRPARWAWRASCRSA
jgi:hypothetical protein